MEITLENTNIWVPNLKEKLQEVYHPAPPLADRPGVWDLEMVFSEKELGQIMNLEDFPVPEEAMPRYRRGKPLSLEEQIDEILSWQLNEAIGFFEERGLILNACSITGVFVQCPGTIRLKLTHKQEPVGLLENVRGKNRKETPMKILSIMPSMTGFINNLNRLAKHIEEQLMNAVGNAALYETYVKQLGFQKVYRLYKTFEENYDMIFSYKTPENEKLRNAFLEILDRECGQEGDEVKNADVMEAVEPKRTLKLVCSVPLYRLTKTGKRGRACTGHVHVVSDGWVLKLQLKLNGKETLPEDIVRHQVEGDGKKKDNRGLLKELRELIAQADCRLREAGYAMDMETGDRVLTYMDFCGMMKQIRKENLK